MTVKAWVLGRMNRMNRRDARTAQGARDANGEPREPTVRALYEGRDAARTVQHLGPYAPLIGAIREELEQFAAGPLRLHLAIAERDRYLLTSVDVDCVGGDEHRELLRRFAHEFRPEQIKHYLAKDVIAGLRNAGAIDLTQFGGLNAGSDDDASDDDGYAALLEELRTPPPSAATRPYKVTLAGRWSEAAPPMPAPAAPRHDMPQTPLAGRTFDVDIDDADGTRRVALTAALPGKRYVVGKGDGCDIAVNGLYASRRHCEIWLERGTWWVADCGSTNGLRVENARGVLGRCEAGVPGQHTLEVPSGASIVLSAHARADTRQYPRIALRAAEASDAADTKSATQTPVTPIAAPRRRDGALTISAHTASGVREIELGDGGLPFGVGRSRNQALVIDWAHEDVSGHHFDIVALDANGASVVVHGDNGVTVGSETHGPGARFRWKPGETLVLGRAGACALTLSRAP